MSAVTQAFFNTLNGDSILTALLGTFNAVPSVMTKRPLPPGFSLKTHGPYVLTSGETIMNPGPADVKNSAGRELVRDILCFTGLDVSTSVVESIAERVKVLFHRKKITIAGSTVIVAEASGPIEVDEDDALGRAVSVRLVMSEP